MKVWITQNENTHWYEIWQEQPYSNEGGYSGRNYDFITIQIEYDKPIYQLIKNSVGLLERGEIKTMNLNLSLTDEDAYLQGWLTELKNKGYRYFVLKSEEFLLSLQETGKLDLFNSMLEDFTEYRKKNFNKSNDNEYFVLNRDEYPQWKSFEEFYEFMKQFKK